MNKRFKSSFKSRSILFGILSLIVGFLIFSENSRAFQFKAGTAKTDITPPMGFSMAGYYSERFASSVHDELFARALVLDDGKNKLVLVICDNIRPFPNAYEKARKLIQNDLGIPPENIIISATHTHTGPRMIEPYNQILSVRIADAVHIANQRLKPAAIKAGVGKEENISFNRRFLMKDGTVRFNPGRLNPDIIKPMGPIDPEIGIFYIVTLDEKPLITFVNFAMHLDTVGGTEISADYPYFMGKILKAVKCEDMMVFFGIGCCGNINHINVKKLEKFPRFGKAEQIGHVLAGDVIKEYPTLKLQENFELKAANEIVLLEIPQYTKEEIERAKIYAKERFSAGSFTKEARIATKILRVQELHGKPIEAEVQTFGIGDIALVSLPGEIFVELGLAIKEKSPFQYTFIIEQSQSDLGYVPDEKAFDEGAYEVEVSRIKKGEGEKFVDAALQLLNKIKKLR